MACNDCSGKKGTVTCMVHNPESAAICKDCCITKFKGHFCKWWELCW